MLAHLLLVLNVSLVILNSAVCSIAICFVAVFKFVLPSAALKAKGTQLANKIMWLWATINSAILNVSNRIEWDIQGGDELKKRWLVLDDQ